MSYHSSGVPCSSSSSGSSNRTDEDCFHNLLLEQFHVPPEHDPDSTLAGAAPAPAAAPWHRPSSCAILLEFRPIKDRLRWSIANALDNLPVSWCVQVVGSPAVLEAVNASFPVEVAVSKIRLLDMGDGSEMTQVGYIGARCLSGAMEFLLGIYVYVLSDVLSSDFASLTPPSLPHPALATGVHQHRVDRSSVLRQIVGRHMALLSGVVSVCIYVNSALLPPEALDTQLNPYYVHVLRESWIRPSASASGTFCGTSSTRATDGGAHLGGPSEEEG